MNLESLSRQYLVKSLGDTDIPDIYSLCLGNPLFYQYCPPAVTVHSIRRDMAILPPGKSLEDKYFIGFYMEGTLIAVMDLISGYPDSKTAYIGFFMMKKEQQRNGTGTAIISETCEYLKASGFSAVRLVFAKGNPQSEHFWTKNQFVRTGKETVKDNFTAIEMERRL